MMTLFKHEMRQGSKSLVVWTAVISFVIAVCVFMYPEMKGEMDGVSDMFASMGAFTEAFGMDKVNFGTLIGFYTIECGNVFGIGGAFFAALHASGILSKEEKDGTAEFLITHPVRRSRIVSEKLLALVTQIALLNAVVFCVSVVSVAVIDEQLPWKEFCLIHLAYFLLQLELGAICFGISAFLKKGSLGIGIGVTAIMYFFNIVANISDSSEFLKYLTPYGYADGADIAANGRLDAVLVVIGVAVACASVALAYSKYTKKDIS